MVDKEVPETIAGNHWKTGSLAPFCKHLPRHPDRKTLLGYSSAFCNSALFCSIFNPYRFHYYHRVQCLGYPDDGGWLQLG